MSPRDLAVYLLAVIDEYAEVALPEMIAPDTPEWLSDYLEHLQQKAQRLGDEVLGQDRSDRYSDGTSPHVEYGNAEHVIRFVRTPSEPTEPTEKQKAVLGRPKLEVVK